MPPLPPPPVDDSDDEIDLMIAGQPVATEIPPLPPEDREEDVQRQAVKLYSMLSELLPLLTEAVAEISPDAMLHAELLCSIDEAKLLVSACNPREPVGRTATTNPWGGRRRVRSEDAAE